MAGPQGACYIKRGGQARPSPRALQAVEEERRGSGQCMKPQGPAQTGPEPQDATPGTRPWRAKEDGPSERARGPGATEWTPPGHRPIGRGSPGAALIMRVKQTSL